MQKEMKMHFLHGLDYTQQCNTASTVHHNTLTLSTAILQHSDTLCNIHKTMHKLDPLKKTKIFVFSYCSAVQQLTSCATARHSVLDTAIVRSDPIYDSL